jgi:hypothetical protein
MLDGFFILSQLMQGSIEAVQNLTFRGCFMAVRTLLVLICGGI